MILVTGASGFIGRHLVPRLSVRSDPLILLSRSPELKLDGARWGADLTQRRHLRQLEKQPQVPDTVIHLAGRVEIALRPGKEPAGPPVPGPEDISEIYSVNVIATANLLEYCLNMGVRHLIFPSSQAVYGIPARELLDEDAPCSPLEHYASSKLCCEEILRVGSRQGLRVTVLRIPGIYSEDRTSGMVYQFMQNAISDNLIRVQGVYPLPVDVLHIGDLIHAFEMALDFGGRGYSCLNISTGEPCSLDILADTIASLRQGCKVSHAEVPQPVVKLDPSRAERMLGWRSLPQRVRLQSMLRFLQDARRSG